MSEMNVKVYVGKGSFINDEWQKPDENHDWQQAREFNPATNQWDTPSVWGYYYKGMNKPDPDGENGSISIPKGRAWNWKVSGQNGVRVRNLVVADEASTNHYTIVAPTNSWEIREALHPKDQDEFWVYAQADPTKSESLNAPIIQCDPIIRNQEDN